MGGTLFVRPGDGGGGGKNERTVGFTGDGCLRSGSAGATWRDFCARAAMVWGRGLGPTALMVDAELATFSIPRGGSAGDWALVACRELDALGVFKLGRGKRFRETGDDGVVGTT